MASSDGTDESEEKRGMGQVKDQVLDQLACRAVVLIGRNRVSSSK